MEKNILLVDFGDTGNESEAIRQVLERYGYYVLLFPLGRPNDLIQIFKNDIKFFKFDTLILSCHSKEDGKIIMPVLGENIYLKNEPRGNFGAVEIRKYFKLTNKTILNLGCYTGKDKKMVEIFSEHNNYIAPVDVVLGNSALNFVLNLFYYLKDYELETAYIKASSIDSETKLFKLYKNKHID